MTRWDARTRDIPGVLHSAGRLLMRHWPALMVIGLVGAAVRSAAIWTAVIVSDKSGWAGQLILIVAPLAYLVAIIAMIQLCRQSLAELPPGRSSALLDIAISVLVPFLTVYVAAGLFEDDHSRFINQAAFKEHNQVGVGVQYDFSGRLGVFPGQIVVMIIAIAWVLRWVLGQFDRKVSFLGLALVGALVDVYYSTVVARMVDKNKDGMVGWVEHRNATHWLVEPYGAVIDRLGPFAHPVDAFTTWLFSLLGSVDAVVVVPLAWLTVGAVVLGHQLAEPEPEPGPASPATPTAWRKGWSVLRSLTSDIRERFTAFWGGLKLLATAGLGPMLGFCIAFLLVLKAELLVGFLIRHLVGPVDTDTWLAFSPMEGVLSQALEMALIAVLLTAALDWLLVRRPSTPDAGIREPARAS
ncbi:MAG TPA: hypothetical protein VM093_03380 [Aeromicrobium sp.]|nr:hypothetical protein [Aeromicrobium sp.]